MKMMRYVIKAIILGSVLLLFSARSFAAACPTDTLGNVIALGSCTIGDATLTFGPAQLPPNPIYFPGPYAGDSGPGPSASQIQFVPDTTAGNPGFTLNGPFSATGGFSCKYGSGLCGNGNFYDEQLGYFSVSVPSGKGIAGNSVAISGAVVSTDDTQNSVVVSTGYISAYLLGSGASQLSGAYTFGSPLQNLANLMTFRNWDYTGNTSSVASFTGAQINFSEIATVPLSPAVWLFGSGLLGLLGIARRRRVSV